MDGVILFSLIAIVYVYAGYPFILGLAGIIIRRPVEKEDVWYDVSIIIPAHNEEKVIADKLENCLSLDYPKDKLEIMVGSDGSDDRTNSIVDAYRGRGVVLSYDENRVGKSSVIMRCVNIARGDIIVFSDADAILQKNALKKLVRSFADPSIGCVEGVRRDIDKKGMLLDSLYWKYETTLKMLNSNLHSLIGATGAIFAIRKSLYMPIDSRRGDDFEIPIRVLLQGYGSVLEPEALAYHPWLSNKDEFGRISRIVSWMMPSAFILLSEAVRKGRWLLAFQLISHKILRWFVPVFMMLLLAANIGSHHGIWGALLLVQAAFYFSAAIGYLCDKKGVKIPSALKVPYFFCLINLASLAGILKLLSGRSEMNWAKTARGGRQSNDTSERKMRVLIITQDEPFYLPVFFEKVLPDLGEDVVGISIIPERGSKIDKVRKYIGFYGLWQFGKKLMTYAWCRISDAASRILPVKKLRSIGLISRRYGIPVIEAKNINSREFIDKIKELKIDLVISVASPQIFRKELIRTPPLGCINVHGAPLPRYRGMLPSFWMLFNKEPKGAVTVHYIDEGIDSGEIILQKEYDIPPAITHHQLIAMSKKVAADALLEAVRMFKRGAVVRRPNDARQATYYSFPDRSHLSKFYESGGRLQ